MSEIAEKLTDDLLALSEEDRKGVFLRLAQSLPDEVSELAESSRRAQQMRSGTVSPMTETTFARKVKQLRRSFSHA